MHLAILKHAWPPLQWLLVTCCTLHLYAQYPGPAEDKSVLFSAAATGNPRDGLRAGLTPFEYSAQRQPDEDAVFPAIGAQAPSAVGAVSVEELKHPLSRRGRSLITTAQNDLHAGKTAEGLSQLAKALHETSAIPYAHSILGATYLELSRIPEAISELERAVQLLPLAVNYANLGYAYWISGDAVRGEEELRHALELDSSSPQTHYLVGLLLLDHKSRSHEACEQLQRAQRAVRTAQMALAVCYERAGQDDAADRQVRAFVGSADDSSLGFWRHWVSWLAGQSHPSIAFGLRTE